MVCKVGITGHRPPEFKDIENAKGICREVVRLVQAQYNDPELCFNLGGCIGADQWVGGACIERGIKFQLLLPFPPEVQSKYWDSDQKSNLMFQVDSCASLTVIGPSYKRANYFIRDRAIVDQSDFLICFWEERKYGGTYETIKYAIKQKKIILNGLKNLSLVTREQVEKA